MKKLILIIFASTCISIVKAQQPVDTATANAINAVDPSVIAKKIEAENSSQNTYTAVEIQPKFAGSGTIFQFIAGNIRYPANAVKNRIQGKVIVQFIVDINGGVNDVTVLKSVSPDLDEEAVRVVKLTRWVPGVQNGRKVRVRFALPISYKLPPIDTAAQSKPASDADALTQPKQAVSSPSYPDMSAGQIFSAVEHEPTFPGGWSKLDDYISLYLKQSHNTYEGRVVVQFVVEKDGSLSNLKVIRGINPDADALAITIMKNCPKFNPGMQNGHVVRVYFTAPIKFINTSSE